MKRYSQKFPVFHLSVIRQKIDLSPHYQRSLVWGRGQKQLLIDTILRDLDIPKLYFRVVAGENEYEVIDGQQRLAAIFDFVDGNFPLRADADDVEGLRIAGFRFEDLADDLKLRLNGYNLDVVLLHDAGEDEAMEMFLRLQNGTSLKAAEKRNAMPGQMTHFIRDLARHPFFTSCRFSNKRYDYDHVAAQATRVELNGGPCDIKNKDLERMYEDHIAFDGASAKARKVRRVLDGLHQAFPQKKPELERYNAINMYMMLSHLHEAYAFKGREGDLAKWFLAFEAHRRGQLDKPEDEQDQRLVGYHERTQHATDSADSLQFRLDFLMEQFFRATPDIPRLDGQRAFSHHQREALFRRDARRCQLRIKCDGRECDWDSWEADHRVPWSQGGTTTVDNGQVACPSCNAAKGAAAA